MIKKIHYQIYLPDGKKGIFKKFVYEQLTERDFLVVHYVGDEREAVDFPHGNDNSLCATVLQVMSYLSEVLSINKT